MAFTAGQEALRQVAMGDDDDRVLLTQLEHEVLDGGGGDRVQRRARFVHEDDVRLSGDGPGDAQSLLLPTGEAVTELLELVLDLLPQGCLTQALLDVVIHVGDLHHGHPRAVGDVVVDGLRERIGQLEHHADAATDLDRIHTEGIDVLVVIRQRPLHPGGAHQVVHAIQAAKEGTRPLLGAVDTEVQIEPGQRLIFVARNGLLNHQPFAATVRQGMEHARDAMTMDG